MFHFGMMFAAQQGAEIAAKSVEEKIFWSNKVQRETDLQEVPMI
jgi:hypothetical protein